MLVGGTNRRYYRGISVTGEGVAGPADILLYKKEDFIGDPRPVSLILRPGVTGLEPGFLDVFLTLKELIADDTVTHIGMSEAARELLRANGTVVRGRWDSYAEEFAREYGLGFMHRDIVIADAGDYSSRAGRDVVTLCFSPAGSPFVDMDNSCAGSSAGNKGGGSVSCDLPEDFFETMSPEDIAGLCPDICYDAIVNSVQLTEFLLGAMDRGGFAFGPGEGSK
ncbi:MAG: hypothetical protein IK083_03515 [Abditibacteriota bacterium]|nr:hypothetical protein [Abditibacteriota bacterium]